VLHVENIGEILQELLERLDSQQAHCDFEFPFFLEKAAPVSGAIGLIG